MITLNGYYDNGVLKLAKESPVKKGNVVVIFTAEEKKEKMSDDDWALFERLSGSVKEPIFDEKEELIEGLIEKYESIN